MKEKTEIIKVQGANIAITHYNDDYNSLTDMTRKFEGGEELVKNRMRSQNTVLFLGTWEKLYKVITYKFTHKV